MALSLSCGLPHVVSLQMSNARVKYVLMTVRFRDALLSVRLVTGSLTTVKQPFRTSADTKFKELAQMDYTNHPTTIRLVNAYCDAQQIKGRGRKAAIAAALTELRAWQEQCR